MLDFMVNHSYFFIFVTWISLIIFFNFWWYSRKCWQKKLKLWWYSWNAKKKNWNHLLARLGPRGSAPASAPRFALRSGLRSAPRAQPSQQVVSIYFIFAFHETTKVSIFLPPFSWNHPKYKQIIIETRLQKKERFPIKTLLMVNFGKKTAILSTWYFAKKKHQKCRNITWNHFWFHENYQNSNFAVAICINFSKVTNFRYWNFD